MTYTINGQEVDLTSLISIGDPEPSLFLQCDVKLIFMKGASIHLNFNTNENECESVQKSKYEFDFYCKYVDGTRELFPKEDFFPARMFDKSIFKVRVTDQINIMKERWKEAIGERQLKIINAISEIIK